MHLQPTLEKSVADQLICLHQHSTSAHDYTLQFHTLVASSGWNEAALLAAYWQGLDPQIWAMMAIYGDTVGLENFMLKAVKSASSLASLMKPLIHQPQPLPLLQYQK